MWAWRARQKQTDPCRTFPAAFTYFVSKIVICSGPIVFNCVLIFFFFHTWSSHVLTAAVQYIQTVFLYVLICCVINAPQSRESIYRFQRSLWPAAVHADSISIDQDHRLSLLYLANTLRAHVSLTSSAAQSSSLCYTVITLYWHLSLLKVGI